MLFYTKQTGFNSLSKASKTQSCQMHFFNLSLLGRSNVFFQILRITRDMHLSPSIRSGLLSTTAEWCRCIGSMTEREKTIGAASSDPESSDPGGTLPEHDASLHETCSLLPVNSFQNGDWSRLGSANYKLPQWERKEEEMCSLWDWKPCG